MQNKNVKKLLIFSLIFLNSLLSTGNELDKGMKFFKEKKTVKALECFNKIFESKSYPNKVHLYTAYCYEANNNIAEALYHLQKYYNNKPSAELEYKILNLANKHQLKGYNTKKSPTQKSYWEVIIIALGAMILFSALFFLKNQFYTSIAGGLAAVCLLTGVIFFNLNSSKSEGVIINDAYFMRDASAGAKQIGYLSKGHKIKVIDETDTWYQVSIANQIGYLRKASVKLL